ncbi:battenin CLN3 protein [Haplosporangium sp. Z 11]|nr:battenin CLN3 protein [Haplosporangium sp. Z 11]
MAETITVRLLGVMMASLSSGFGEITFLMLSSFYRLQMVSAWSSGTGGAGLLGALMFLALTSWFGLSIPRTLGVVAMFPIMMLVAYFIILTSPSSSTMKRHSGGYQPIASLNTGNDDELLTSPQTFHQSQYQEDWDSPPTLVSTNEQDRSTSGSDVNSIRKSSSIHPRHPHDSSEHLPTSPPLVTSSHHSSAPSVTVTTYPSVDQQINSMTAPSTAATGSSRSSAPWDLSTPWDAPQSQQPQHQTEPTSINTLLAATDPDDPGFVSPFRESEIEDGTGSTSSSRRKRRVYYKVHPNEPMSLQEKLNMARSLLVPFMVPLFMVYVAEYTMNQGVLPVILFPLNKTPFAQIRDHYVTYSAIYQLGVFISRSSASLIKISRLWIPSFLQLLTLLLATSQALLSNTHSQSISSASGSLLPDVAASAPPADSTFSPFPIPSIYLIFLLILWEGLLGGATYVHTYIGISKNFEHDPKGKEFALGAVGVADGLGIMVAGIASLWIEPALCRWQVERGVELCLAMAD